MAMTKKVAENTDEFTGEVAEASPTTSKKQVVINSVKMDDGRIVDFPGKRKLSKEVLLNEDGTVQIRMDFVNGETRLYTVGETLFARFAGHGASQKLGDECSGVNDVEDMVLAVDDLMDRLARGEWTIQRTSSGHAGASVLAKAIAEVKGCDVQVARKFLMDKTQAQKFALRANPAIAPIIARLEAGKVKKQSGIDTDALLEDFQSE